MKAISDMDLSCAKVFYYSNLTLGGREICAGQLKDLHHHSPFQTHPPKDSEESA